MANDNPIIALWLLVQAGYGKSLSFSKPIKRGPDNEPIIRVRLTLPDGKEFTSDGKNQREARQDAATMALRDLQIV